MSLADPYWLVLLPVLLIAALLTRRRRRGRTVLFSNVRDLKALPRTLVQRARPFVDALAPLGLGLCVIALARPRAGLETGFVTSDALALQLVLDKSVSMRETDMDPDPWDQTAWTRLDVVKDVVRDFVDEGGALPGRPNDLLGLVSFAGFVQSHCPLTLDHPAFLRLLADVQMPSGDARDPRMREESMTAIGDALVIGVERVKDAPAKSRVIVLLSDGESNIGEASPMAGAEAAAAAGVRVYTIGVGTPGKGLDEDTLKGVAERTGGLYFSARDAGALQKVYEAIDQLERTQIDAATTTRWQERFSWFLVVGLALVLAHRLLSDARFRSLP